LFREEAFFGFEIALELCFFQTGDTYLVVEVEVDLSGVLASAALLLKRLDVGGLSPFPDITAVKCYPTE